MAIAMFEGFTSRRIKTSGAEIALMHGGSGSPLLLIHGYPQSHVIWHKVAPRLAERFTLVVPDLRGYGASSKPATDKEHLPYSKRAMALDMVEVMRALGFDRFDVAGHDRGARVTYRLALDHPDHVRRGAVLDIIPTLEQFERVDRFGARAIYHWYFLTQPAPFPENLIGKDPDYFLEHSLQSWRGLPGGFTDEALAAYREAFRSPEVIHATCEDYRAGITCDCKFDEADRAAGRKIEAPVLALWGARGRPNRGAGILEVWKRWAADVRGEGLECGHFIPEEAADELAERLISFFGDSAVG
ncbi:MAG TPA: alpha/beta hydrolase [Candidatus Binataceae bacterium]|nr:alpha/beta hydrolase [Candidatus Binataceae bacterium]